MRKHAVSLFHGDYTDYNENDGIEDPFPLQDDDDDDDDDNNNTMIDNGEESYGHDLSKEIEEMSAYVRANQIQMDERKRKWEKAAAPKVWEQVLDARGRAYGRGSRKEASAQVWIQPGEGVVVVNRMDFVDYFTRETHRKEILAPFMATANLGNFDVRCFVQGGGMSGQAGAIKLGVSRALQAYDPANRLILKELGYLTRDPRMVERKKVGKVKARKSPQWVRR
eukprot:CAMPEP_0118681412 /NCGR_PEP_ID=MMETSP0800-20121206/4926_1 /TAXON_ID=210618 ORGANISM="Striatella unipunctata, Strain CCMP2910" /NCGR_SAMPLE_ID=MMETSP0800 /ASSEMBLY_ACC=CAM_ASM_000638 /LENGTH=223 /DNA_ID=CAMNT_0006577709 /DNA_START=75 /DNA_END=746 /DNA_ORIENTATION=-